MHVRNMTTENAKHNCEMAKRNASEKGGDDTNCFVKLERLSMVGSTRHYPSGDSLLVVRHSTGICLLSLSLERDW